MEKMPSPRYLPFCYLILYNNAYFSFCIPTYVQCMCDVYQQLLLQDVGAAILVPRTLLILFILMIIKFIKFCTPELETP